MSTSGPFIGIYAGFVTIIPTWPRWWPRFGGSSSRTVTLWPSLALSNIPGDGGGGSIIADTGSGSAGIPGSAEVNVS